MELQIGLYLLVALTVGIFFTYKIKSDFIRWLLIVVPPLFIISLYWVPWDISTVVFWIPAHIAFWWAILSLVFNVVRIIIRKLRKKPQIEYVKMRFIRPVLTIAIFLPVYFFAIQSLLSADEFAKEMGKKIQADSDANGMCPKKIQDWEVDKRDPNINKIMYGKYGAKYPLRYYVSENGKEFNIRVYHNIDEAFYVRGGVDRKLAATYSGPDKDVNVPIE
jgi:hypothetical protein